MTAGEVDLQERRIEVFKELERERIALYKTASALEAIAVGSGRIVSIELSTGTPMTVNGSMVYKHVIPGVPLSAVELRDLLLPIVQTQDAVVKGKQEAL